ncbi:MAG: hypothetical protein N2045_13015 [Fimbriimonadales bacterium]|nr:hypothetical protein [Fimbriimonadales bacterium]
MPPTIVGTLREILEQYPDLAERRVRVQVLDNNHEPRTMLEYLGDWVGSVNIPDAPQSDEVEQVVAEAISEKSSSGRL